ncbi:hypothetical protein BDZ45DRAFT_81111 [Acephala macrosclerotiorum]|nr:hypothetical protein BDZ45DRAFT_81111 [Acephala macrosclerotiorum]
MTLTTPCRGCCNPNCPSGVRRCTCLNPNNCPFLRFFEKEKMWEAKRVAGQNPLQMTPIRETIQRGSKMESSANRIREVKSDSSGIGLPAGYVPGWARDEESEEDHSGSERDS